MSSLCLSVREDISRITHNLYQILRMLPMSMARSSSDLMSVDDRQHIAYQQQGVTGVHSAGEV